MADDRAAIQVLQERVKSDGRLSFRALLDEAGSSKPDPGKMELAWQFAEAQERREAILAAHVEATVVREPEVYEKGNPEISFFRDLAAAVSPTPMAGTNPVHARERLERHQNHGKALREADARGAERRAAALGIQTGRPDGSPTQSRALSSIVPGSGGVFVPPKWMTEDFASVVRAAAPLRKLVRTIPLPPDTMELHVPRINVSGGVLADSSENINPPIAASATDQLIAPVCTFTGEIPVSQALWERGSFDAIAVPDFAENYAQALEFQLVNGTGTGGQMLGMLNVSTSAVSAGVPGAILTTYTDAAPTPGKVVQAIAQAAGQVSDARDRPPSFILCRGGRYFWIAGVPDTGGEPAQRVGTGTPPTDADTGPFGPIAGLPVYIDQSLPSTLGAGSNQDVAVVCRGRDIILLEEPEPHFQAFVDTAGGAAELTVILAYHTYAAAFTNRYPSAIGSVTGTGFVLPAGW